MGYRAWPAIAAEPSAAANSCGGGVGTGKDRKKKSNVWQAGEEGGVDEGGLAQYIP